MNVGLNSNDPTISYYDGDYPSPFSSRFPENFDSTTKAQGIEQDIARFQELAASIESPVLELCCGTGRVAIPLARNGIEVCGVDVSSGMLAQFRSNLSRESEQVGHRISLFEQDVTHLDLDKKDFRFAYIAFNSLLCIPSFEGQTCAIQAAADHLAPGGLFAIDILNPMTLRFEGDSTPKLFFTRRNPENGNLYSRFSMLGPMDENQKQELHGWYDEIGENGTVARQFYSRHWRPIFRFEIELMLKQAGLQILAVEGGHLKEPYTAQSPTMFIQARKS